MGCNCETCKAADEELAEKLSALGTWLIKRGSEGRNGATTRSMLKRKLIKIGIIDIDRGDELWL